MPVDVLCVMAFFAISGISIGIAVLEKLDQIVSAIEREKKEE